MTTLCAELRYVECEVLLAEILRRAVFEADMWLMFELIIHSFCHSNADNQSEIDREGHHVRRRLGQGS